MWSFLGVPISTSTLKARCAEDLRVLPVPIRSYSYQKNTCGRHPAKILPLLSDQSRNVQEELDGLELIEGPVEKCLYVRQAESTLSVSGVEDFSNLGDDCKWGSMELDTTMLQIRGFSHTDSVRGQLMVEATRGGGDVRAVASARFQCTFILR